MQLDMENPSKLVLHLTLLITGPSPTDSAAVSDRGKKLILNHTAKEIWDNVEMLMQGSGRTIQQRKEDLFDEYERFRAIGNESIHDYFVRFHKLWYDMKITQSTFQLIDEHQVVNNLRLIGVSM
ncbi:hypothetical protein Tco_1249921 [Tanacetum coccineum]